MAEGKLTPMGEIRGFWTEAIHAGVRALGFSLRELTSGRSMAAELACDDVPSAVRRAAAAAIEVDKEIANWTRLSPVVMARALLMARLEESPAAVELENYQRLLAIEVLRRVAADPPSLLEALAEPHL